MIERDIFSILNKDLTRKEIMALVGPRQIGKTTIMKELFKKCENNGNFISFENFKLRDLFENNIELFIETYVKNNKFLFIDEFQYAKNGGKQLKFIFDSYDNIKIVISGSSQPELAIHSLQYLVGRVRIYEILPLTFKEFIQYKSNLNKVLFNEIRNQDSFKLISLYFEEYLIYGGYPCVVVENTFDEKKLKLQDIVNTYLLKDIKDILSYKNIYEFENVLKKLALQDGKLLNKSSISMDFEINKNKISEIISVLSKTYVLYLLQPYFNNKSKELIKSPKTYFLDLGFKNLLINNFNNLDLKSDKGEIYENFICNQLFRSNFKLNFWNEKNRYEVDFVLEKDGNIYGFEIKSKLSNSNLTNSLKKFIEEFSPKIIYVFNENIDDEIKYEKTKVIFTNYMNIFKVIENFK